MEIACDKFMWCEFTNMLSMHLYLFLSRDDLTLIYDDLTIRKDIDHID